MSVVMATPGVDITKFLVVPLLLLVPATTTTCY
jgi:hypothetical protein